MWSTHLNEEHSICFTAMWRQFACERSADPSRRPALWSCHHTRCDIRRRPCDFPWHAATAASETGEEIVNVLQVRLVLGFCGLSSKLLALKGLPRWLITFMIMETFLCSAFCINFSQIHFFVDVQYLSQGCILRSAICKQSNYHLTPMKVTPFNTFLVRNTNTTYRFLPGVFYSSRILKIMYDYSCIQQNNTVPPLVI